MYFENIVNLLDTKRIVEMKPSKYLRVDPVTSGSIRADRPLGWLVKDNLSNDTILEFDELLYVRVAKRLKPWRIAALRLEEMCCTVAAEMAQQRH